MIDGTSRMSSGGRQWQLTWVHFLYMVPVLNTYNCPLWTCHIYRYPFNSRGSLHHSGPSFLVRLGRLQRLSLALEDLAHLCMAWTAHCFQLSACSASSSLWWHCGGNEHFWHGSSYKGSLLVPALCAQCIIGDTSYKKGLSLVDNRFTVPVPWNVDAKGIC